MFVYLRESRAWAARAVCDAGEMSGGIFLCGHLRGRVPVGASPLQGPRSYTTRPLAVVVRLRLYLYPTVRVVETNM